MISAKKKHMVIILWMGVILGLLRGEQLMADQAIEQTNMRDVFIYPDRDNKLYYVFAFYRWHNLPPIFYYTSPDLKTLSQSRVAFSPESDFFCPTQGWAPEVHSYRGRYYILTSFKGEDSARGTYILSAQNVGGPYSMHSAQPLTPPSLSCLDGTLYVDESEQPWLVYSREWTDTGMGELYGVKLKDDLSAALANPLLLFRGSDVPWNVDMPWEEPVAGESHAMVLEAPFLYRMPSGTLWMIYSGFAQLDGQYPYTIGAAWSETGKVTGPWHHLSEPLHKMDGAHGMIFKSLTDDLVLCFHSPNTNGQEKAVLMKIKESGKELLLSTWSGDNQASNWISYE